MDAELPKVMVELRLCLQKQTIASWCVRAAAAATRPIAIKISAQD
jgi:hypothetical protein